MVVLLLLLLQIHRNVARMDSFIYYERLLREMCMDERKGIYLMTKPPNEALYYCYSRTPKVTAGHREHPVSSHRRAPRIVVLRLIAAAPSPGGRALAVLLSKTVRQGGSFFIGHHPGNPFSLQRRQVPKRVPLESRGLDARGLLSLLFGREVGREVSAKALPGAAERVDVID